MKKLRPVALPDLTPSSSVYDPSLYSDQVMLEMSQNAGAKMYDMYLQNPAERKFTVDVGGVKFEGYINFDPKTGAPYVGTVYPKKGE